MITENYLILPLSSIRMSNSKVIGLIVNGKFWIDKNMDLVEKYCGFLSVKYSVQIWNPLTLSGMQGG